MERWKKLSAIASACACAVLMSSVPASAQSDSDDDPFRAWLMYFGDHPIKNGKWGIHFDGQYRINQFGSGYEQLLLRPGVNYDFNETVQLSGGYAFIRDAMPNGFDVPEHRFWQQLILRQRIGTVGVVHRYRLEQRLVGQKVPGEDGQGELDGYQYRNRIRYFIKGTFPFGESKYFLGAYNELMVNFGVNVDNNYFDQNRTYIALGRRLGPIGNLEIGYLLQLNQRRGGGAIATRHIFQVGFFSSARIGS